MSAPVMTVAELRRLAEWCAEVEMIRKSYGLHAGHSRRFVEPHWVVCSCGKRAIARAGTRVT